MVSVGYFMMLYNLMFTIVQVKSDITVSEFPDYVMRMTEEDEHNNTMLAYEYWVFNIMYYSSTSYDIIILYSTET